MDGRVLRQLAARGQQQHVVTVVIALEWTAALLLIGLLRADAKRAVVLLAVAMRVKVLLSVALRVVVVLDVAMRARAKTVLVPQEEELASQRLDRRPPPHHGAASARLRTHPNRQQVHL